MSSTTGSPMDSPLLRAFSPQPSHSNDKPTSPVPGQGQPIAAKRKVMSFFSSLSSERSKHQHPQSSASQQSTDHPDSHQSTQPTSLQLSLTLPESELVPHIHSQITAAFEQAAPSLHQSFPQPTAVVYQWTRIKDSETPITLSSTTNLYVATIEDVDCNIRCETTISNPDQSAIIITDTARSIGPITLSPAFIKSALQPFQSNNTVVSAVDATDNTDVSIAIRRTSIRITAALSGQTKHSFRISSTASNTSLKVSLVADDSEHRSFMLNDSKTERMFKARCSDSKQRDAVFYLLRLLLERPDFAVDSEIAEIEKLDSERQQVASEKKAVEDAEIARVRAELQKAEDDARQAAAEQAASEQAAPEAAAHAAEQTSVSASIESTEPTMSPLASVTSTPQQSPHNHVDSTTPASTSTEIINQPEPNIVEVFIYPVGHHAKLLTSSSNDVEVAHLKQQIASLHSHMQDDGAGFSLKLEALKGDRHTMLQERQALVQAHEAHAKKQSDEITRLQHELNDAHADFDSLKKSNSSTLDQVTRQHAEAIASQAEESKKMLDKVTAKANSTEQALRKELDLYKREVARLKEKEARVDVLEMENHRLGREYAALNEEYTSFKSSISADRTTTDSALSELQEQKARYDALLGTVTSERDRYKAEVEELNEQAIELADQLMSAESAQASLTIQVEELTSRLSKAESELATHTSSSSTLQSELETARARIDQLESEANYGKKQQQTLRAQIERFIKSQAQFKQQIKESESFQQESKDEIMSLKVENSNLLNRISSMEQAARQAALIDSGHASAGSDAVSVGAQALQIDALKSLCNRLTEQINDQDTALVHLKRTNQILGVRVKELEERFADQLKDQTATNGKPRR